MSRANWFAVGLMFIGTAIRFLFGAEWGWVFLAIGVAVLIVTLYPRTDVAASVEAQPNIVFDRVSDSMLQLHPQHDYVRVHVYELWFKNKPQNNVPDATARSLTAHVRFVDAHNAIVVEMVGQWAISQQPEHVGWIALSPAIDLPPVHTWGKLLLISETDVRVDRRHDDAVVSEVMIYALSGENLHAHPVMADHEAYRLPQSVTHARVTLAAANMNHREYEFRLVREADGLIESIKPITLS